jgi:hypothetical protein
VAQECRGAAGEKRGDEMRMRHQAPMADGKIAAMKQDQVCSPDEAVDCMVGESYPL